MPSVVTGLLDDIARARQLLGKTSGNQLHSKVTREKIRTLAESYFKVVRPSLISNAAQDPDVASVDSAMQAIIQLCHKRGAVKGYRDLLTLSRQNLINLDARLLSAPLTVISAFGESDLDRHIIQTLEKLLPSAAASYKQAACDMKEAHRFSWRGPATDFREALRETLDHLAPDVEVKKMESYKQEPDAKGPTMKQKVRYILKSRGKNLSQSGTPESAIDAIEETIGSFVRSVYTRSNLSTHTPTNKDEVLRVRDFVRVVFSELLEIRC